MKSFAETQKYQTTLLGDVHAHVLRRAAQDDGRRQDIIHPSEMAKHDLCPRQVALRIGGAEPSDSAPVNGYTMETIFQEGHDIHTKWQTWLWQMGRLWGMWRCRSCGFEWLDTSPSECTQCGSDNIEYREVPLNAEDEYLMTGHADGAVPDLNAFIEVKSIGLGTLRIEEPALVREYTVTTTEGDKVVNYDQLWKDIKRPLPGHRKQGGLYLAIAALRGMPYDRMVYIYENKANQQVKEFVLKYSERQMEPLLAINKDIQGAVREGRMLPRPDGFKKSRKPCTSCVFRTMCWRDDDDESTPLEDAEHGEPVVAGQADPGPSADLRTRPTRRTHPRPARRSNRPDRQRVDEADGGVDEVGGLPASTTRRRGSRRAVSRRARAQGDGDQVAGEQD